jgi:hypothetical protein
LDPTFSDNFGFGSIHPNFLMEETKETSLQVLKIRIRITEKIGRFSGESPFISRADLNRNLKNLWILLIIPDPTVLVVELKSNELGAKYG